MPSPSATSSAAAPSDPPTGVDGDAATGDGRSARRQRNIDAVLDVAIDLFTEGVLFPSIEQVALRSGVSARSIYRYFADPHALSEAAIRRHRQRYAPLAHLPAIGEGPLAERIEAFVAMRIRLHEAIGATYMASVHNAPLHPGLAARLGRGRTQLREQFERQFGPELARLEPSAREATVAAGDLLTQLDSIQLLRHHRELSAARTADTLRLGLHALLGAER